MADLYPGDVYIAPSGTEPGDGGWTHIGRTEGGLTLHLPADSELPAVPFRPVSFSVTVDYSGALAEFERLIHNIDRACFPRKHRRCHTCHPKWSRPLAVNGHEYHRRQLARQRKRRRA